MMVIVLCDKLHEVDEPQVPLEARMQRRTCYDRIVGIRQRSHQLHARSTKARQQSVDAARVVIGTDRGPIRWIGRHKLGLSREVLLGAA
jgi:hypothetical protein